MQPPSWERRGGLGGIIAAATIVTATFMLLHSPRTDQPTSDISAYFSEERGRALAATYLIGLGPPRCCSSWGHSRACSTGISGSTR